MDSAGSIGASELLTVLGVALPFLVLKVALVWLVFGVVRDAIRWVRRARRPANTSPE